MLSTVLSRRSFFHMHSKIQIEIFEANYNDERDTPGLEFKMPSHIVTWEKRGGGGKPSTRI